MLAGQPSLTRYPTRLPHPVNYFQLSFMQFISNILIFLKSILNLCITLRWRARWVHVKTVSGWNMSYFFSASQIEPVD